MTPSDDPGAGASGAVAAASEVESCAECGRTLSATDRVEAGGRVFCRSCHANLRAELEQAVAAMSTDVPYVPATLGAILGGTVGVLLWWGFTVLTSIAFGLVAVAIGFLVGQGAVRFAGGKRSRGLQIMSVAVSLVGFVIATYLVNMTFINRALAQSGESYRVAFPPQTPGLFTHVIGTNLGVMDAVFLAIVVWQAWKIPAPVDLPGPAAPA